MDIVFQIILAIHNLLRWIIVLGIFLVSFYGVYIWFFQDISHFDSFKNSKVFNKNKKFVFYLSILVNIQFLVGFTLYPLSKIIVFGWNNLSESIKVQEIRFFMIEHPIIMIILVGIVHMVYTFIKREMENFYKIQTLLMILVILLIIFGIPWFRPFFRFM